MDKIRSTHDSKEKCAHGEIRNTDWNKSVVTSITSGKRFSGFKCSKVQP
jgi:hypothetical protein